LLKTRSLLILRKPENLHPYLSMQRVLSSPLF
jgi:hypothetical protein